MASGDVLIRDPRALRALAHPDRLAILDRLAEVGEPQTATALGGVVGISPSAASYHLRLLARFGLVEDAGGGTGRNRPWRAVGTGFMFEPADHVSPAGQAAAGLLGAELVARGERESLEFIQSESSLPAEWRTASYLANKMLRLTAAEAGELVRKLDELVEPYLRSTRPEPPADARAVRLLIRLFPREGA